jgi:cytochrome c biogenesis protein
MPKLFASEIVIHDHETGAKTAATVKVNEPAFHRGVAIYQSSFDDGGSTLQLRALPLTAGGTPFTLDGKVGSSTELRTASDSLRLTLEFTGLRAINVENMGSATDSASGTDVRRVDLASSLDKHLGSGSKPGEKVLKNIGPSVSYKLRDAAGQAREFNNYMAPVLLDGVRVLLVGVRENPNEAFRYLRIPVDDSGGIDGWYRLQQALKDAKLRDKAAARYAAQATPADKPEMAEQLRLTAGRTLALFAGAEQPRKPDNGQAPAETGGLPALSDFIEGTVPEGDRSRISEVLLRILNGSLFELAQLSREAAGLPPLKTDEATSRYMTQAVLSLSDAAFYPAPVLLQLTGFNQVQASVFQMARAPGKKLVYLGAVLLIIGVFAMLYIRERRLWIWLAPAADGGTLLQAALSTTRRTLDVDAEFDQLRGALLAPVKDSSA